MGMKESPHITGTTSSHYRILARLGVGGMGEVYLGGRMSIKSDIWIKRMSRELVRSVDDRRIISCGFSSDGNDCRLARHEFKCSCA